MSTYEKLISKLPDAYQKSENSNNYKLLSIGENELNSLREDIQKVTLLTDLANASGETLDLFGEMLDKKRGKLDDDKYKYALQSQIAQNVVSGDFNNVLTALVRMFSLQEGDVTYDDIQIKECQTSGFVKVTKLPLRILNKAGFNTVQTLGLIKNILPIGVNITSIDFEGTFEFCGQEYVYENQKGFGSLSNPDIGGELGGLIG